MVQWFPGHMAKALREMEDRVKLVDLIIILIDSRIPYSSINPELINLFKNKKVLYLFTKKDKADPLMTSKWLAKYSSDGSMAISIDARSNKCIKDITKCVDIIMADKRKKDQSRGLKIRPVKTMIVGIPNVGKSTLINTLVNKKVASVGDRPGVTKSQQWIRLNDSFELLDTPGVLWPKFEDPTVGFNLAISGAINDDILPLDDVCLYFIDFLAKHYPNSLENRYHITLDLNDPNYSNHKVLEDIGRSLHFMIKDEVDIDKTSRYLLQNYRNDLLGHITLDIL